MSATRDRRIELGAQLYRQFGGIVAYGPFKGMTLPEISSWTPADLGPKLLGIYEIEVVDTLRRLLDPGKTIIDVGAADGYYVVGLLSAEWCRNAVAFEINPDGRRNIETMAAINGVADRVTVLGAADDALAATLRATNLDFEQCVMLVDIEGAEHALLTCQMLREFATMRLIVELHGGMVPDGKRLQDDLLDRLKEVFDVEIVCTGARSFAQRPEAAAMNDDDRWLMASEGRPYLMAWAVCTPPAGRRWDRAANPATAP